MEPEDLIDFASDHVDKSVAELITSHNYKQALKNLEKKRKKGSPSHIQVLKAALLCALGEYGESHKTVLDFLARHAPPWQPDVCEQLYINLCCLRDDGRIQVKDKQLEEIWLKSIAAEKEHADKVHLAKDWTFLAIRRGQWQFVLKVCHRCGRSTYLTIL